MRTTSYSDLSKSLAATLDRVTQDHEPVVIPVTVESPQQC
jgi:antitoxin YefM